MALALALLCWGCVEQDPGLLVEVSLQLEALPDTPVQTRSGPLMLVDARLAVDRVELEACPEAMARGPWRWLIGAAHAHGDAEHSDAPLTVTLDTGLAPGETLRGEVPVPLDHPLCAVILHFEPGESGELAIRADGAAHRWQWPMAPLRWAVEPLEPTARQRRLRVRVSGAPSGWLAPFQASSDVEGSLGERLAAGVAGSLAVSVD